jgi:hypothetical protein
VGQGKDIGAACGETRYVSHLQRRKEPRYARRMDIKQLKAALVKAWKKHSQLKKEMAPLLSDLRKALRKQGNRKGEGWGAWVEAGHIGICLRTANRWADEYDGKTSSQKSRSGLKARAAATRIPPLFNNPRPSWLNEERWNRLEKAIDDIGDNDALLMVYELLTGEKVAEAKAASA